MGSPAEFATREHDRIAFRATIVADARFKSVTPGSKFQRSLPRGEFFSRNQIQRAVRLQQKPPQSDRRNA